MINRLMSMLDGVCSWEVNLGDIAQYFSPYLQLKKSDFFKKSDF
jgi:hypothetical protein